MKTFLVMIFLVAVVAAGVAVVTNPKKEDHLAAAREAFQADALARAYPYMSSDERKALGDLFFSEYMELFVVMMAPTYENHIFYSKMSGTNPKLGGASTFGAWGKVTVKSVWASAAFANLSR